MIREENQMLEIRNNATFAQPVSGPDNSRFARPHQELFANIEQPENEVDHPGSR